MRMVWGTDPAFFCFGRARLDYSIQENHYIWCIEFTKPNPILYMSEQTRGFVTEQPGQGGKGYYPKGDNYLFVVGIDEYQHLPKLFNAVKDAKDIIEVLTSKYQFSKDHLVTLFNEKATQSEIIRQLRTLAETIGDDDALLVYFSGHGEFDKIIDTGYWIPVDGRRGEIGTFLSFDMVTKFVKVIHSHHTFIIADSCYSGAIFTDRNAGDALDHLESLPSRWVLTAGRNEVVSDGQQGANSPFADAVLYRLRKNDEPRLPVSNFCNYIIQDVRNNADQLPRGASMHGVGDRGGEFMFRLKEYVKQPFVEKAPEAVVEKDSEPERGDDRAPATPPPKPKVPDTFESLPALKATLKQLVSAHDFEEVFELFNRSVSSSASIYNDLILQQGQYNGLKRSQAQQVISAENLNISKNRIMNALLYYIDELEEEDIKSEVIAPSKPAAGSSILSELDQMERKGLENQARILQKKLNYLRAELDKLSDPNQKFSVEVQIEEAQQQLEEIKVKLGG
jgi:hypothetical protein